MKFLKWILGLFKKRKTKKIKYKQRYKFALMQAHTKKAQGACSDEYQVSEYEYFNKLKPFLNSDIAKGNRDSGLLNGYKMLKSQGEAIGSLEFHLNAFNKKANGYEVLVLKGDDKSYWEAKRFLALMAIYFPEKRSRGIKEISYRGRGYKNLTASKRAGFEISLLTEVFFIDNARDYISNYRKMGKLLNEFCCHKID